MKLSTNMTWNPTIFNTICWLSGLMGQTTHRPNSWCSKHYFFVIMSYRLKALKTVYFYFCNIIKKISKSTETIFAKNFARNYENKWYMKHQTLGRWVICPIGPANQSILLYIVGVINSNHSKMFIEFSI